MNTTKMEIMVSGGRFTKVEKMPDGTARMLVESEAPGLIVPEKKIYLPQSEFERRIDPLAFQLDADWLRYKPRTDRQKKTKKLFLAARAKGRLHAFTCMAIDPSFDPVTGEVVYQPGLPPAVGKSYNWWVDTFKNYAPERNSRVLTKTEGACENLELIRRLVEWKKWAIEKAWNAVCDYSVELGHFADSDNAQNSFEPTGSREICCFYDRGNVYKMMAEDPWKKNSGYFINGAYYKLYSYDYPLVALSFNGLLDMDFSYGTGKLALD